MGFDIMIEFQIVEYTKQGKFIGVIAGQGKNKGTWDSTHSKSSAYRIRKQLRLKYPESVFKVESLH